MKATIVQTTTLRRSVELEWDPDVPFTAEAAIAVAKATKAFDGSTVDAATTYEIHDNDPQGCHVTQVAGRTPSADKSHAGKG